MTIAELFYAKQAQRALLRPLRGRRILPRRRKVLLEPLEPRLLLTATPFTYAAASGATLDLTLRLDETSSAPLFQLIDNSGGTPTVVAQQALADTSQIVITGSEHADRLTIDTSVPTAVPVAFADTHDGDGDTLEIRGGDRTWTVTGANTGTTGNVTFAGVENLIGGSDNRDTFILNLGGSISGGIEGGAGGYDSLVLAGGTYASVTYAATSADSGTITLDGATLAYAGLEPITDNTDTVNRVFTGTGGADQIVLKDAAGSGSMTIESTSGTFESITFNNPSISLTINAGAGNDTITVQSLDSTFNANLVINGDGGVDAVTVDGAVGLTGHDVTITAETITVNAGITTGTGTISLIAEAVDNSVLGDAQAQVVINNATLSGGTIDISASSSVTATASLAFTLPANVALIDVQSDALVSITGSSRIESTGAVTISATSTTTTAALSTAVASGSTAADAAVATSIVHGSAIIQVTDTSAFNVGGALSLSAANTRTVTTTADGTAGGATAAGGSVAVAVVSGDTEVYLDDNAKVESAGSISISAAKLDSITTTAKAASGGATDGGGATQTKSRLSEYDAETSEGAITIAGAVAVTDLTSSTRAYLATHQTVTTAGQLSLESLDHSDASASADGSATGSASTGVGVAVAINLAHVSNTAYLGGTGAISAHAVAVHAGLTPRAGETPLVQAFSATAVAGATAGSVGVAGALALNVVDATSSAVIQSGATVTITGGGDATLTAANTTVSTASATPANEGAAAGSVGVGASVALSIINVTTLAKLEDTAILTGAHNLTLSATSDNTTTTTAKAGGTASGSGGVGVGGAVAIATVNNTTDAVIGSGTTLVPTLTVTGALSATATHTGVTTTVADGTAGGESAAIGIALGLNVVADTTLATTARDVTAGGAVTFAAHASAATSTDAKASAAGAPEEASKKEFTPDKVDLTTNTITLGTGPVYKTGQAVTYSAGGGTAIQGLTDGATYYVISDGKTGTIKLADSEAHAASGTAIDFGNTTAPTGTQSLTPQPYKREFDASTKVSATADTIDLGAGQKFTTGQAVTYSAGGGSAIGGLTSGTTYYVIASDTTGTVKLAATAADARAGKAIDLTSASTGTHSLAEDKSRGVDNQVNAQQNLADKKAKESGTKEFNSSTKVEVGTETIDLGANHGLTTGDAVVYSAGGGTAIGGLTDGTTYYVIVVDATTVKLATTAANAKAGTVINLTAVGSGTQSLTTEAAAKGTGSSTAPAAETSGGGVSVAAAIGINIATSSARAYIPDSGLITAGGILTLSASTTPTPRRRRTAAPRGARRWASAPPSRSTSRSSRTRPPSARTPTSRR
ncbi:MAG: LEPR-XLL domain-containing protein, partial [candidate division NC10 bacterium]|nr:LEPR-XLL domain-containing protein [candidate division NC10 bacterium]